MAEIVVQRTTIVALLLLVASGCGRLPRTYYDSGVSDEVYIRSARAHPDAQAFLDLYPGAEVMVDRSAKLAVDFLDASQAVSATNENWEGIRLRVFLDPETNKPEEAIIQCDNTIAERELRRILTAYATTGICP